MTSPVESAIRGIVTTGIMGAASLNRSMKKAKSPNPYLTGVHTPLTAEQTIEGLKVTGEIPITLNGVYLRNGPNPLKMPNAATHHWFVGDAMLHGVRLQDGQARWYRNRWVRTTPVSEAMHEAPVPGPRGRGSPNTNVVGHAGKILAIVEAGGFPAEMSETLETKKFSDFDGTFGKAFSAHPHLDPETGEMHAITYASGEDSTIWHTVLGTDGKIRRNEPIAVENGPSIHDCMITKNYVIVMDLPVTFSMAALMGGETFPYRWNPKHTARIGLLPREGKGSDIIWCEVEPCYIFHPANAYERDDGVVVMEASVHATMFAGEGAGPDSERVTFERLAIDPKARRVTRTVIDAAPQEFPRADERRTGKPYRYAYTMALPEQRDPAFMGDSRIYKHDLESGAKQTRDFGPGKLPGEFVFIPAHAGAAEDEGWLMGFVIDARRDTTDLVILNAQDFTGPAQASVHIPSRIPPGFHGNYIPLG
jgi:carotenoid cleavage dioxygenase